MLNRVGAVFQIPALLCLGRVNDAGWLEAADTMVASLEERCNQDSMAAAFGGITRSVT